MTSIQSFNFYANKNLIIIVLVLLFSNAFSQKTELILPIGHPDVISSIDVSQDNKFVLSGSEDNLLKLWEIETGLEIRSFEGHKAAITEVALSKDGKFAVSGSKDKTVKIWDISSSKPLKTLQASDWVLSISISLDKNFVAAGLANNNIQIWDFKSGKLLFTLKHHKEYVQSVAFSSNGKYLVSGSKDKFVCLWDISTGKMMKTLKGHEFAIQSVQFSPDDKFILSGGGEYNKGGYYLKLWNTNNGKLVRTYKGHQEKINHIAFSPDNHHFASSSWNKTYLWNLKSGKPVHIFSQKKEGVQSVCFSPKGDFMVTSSVNTPLNTGFGGNIKMWDIKNKQLIKTFSGHSSAFHSIDIDPSGKNLLIGQYKKIKIWNLETLHNIKTIEIPQGSVENVGFSPDGNFALVTSWVSTIVFETKTWSILHEFKGKDFINHAEFSTDNKSIIANYSNNEMTIWDIKSGTSIKNYNEHKYSVMQSKFSSDNKLLVSGSEDKTIKVWDIKESKSIQTFNGHTGKVSSVTFSPNNQHIASGSWDNSIKIWKVESGKELFNLKAHTDCVLSVAYSSDGTQILSGGRDQVLNLWNAKNGSLIHSFKGHKGWVKSIKFIDNNNYAISTGSSDGTIKIWDLKAKILLLTFILIDQEDWMIVGKNNHYACSKNALTKMGFKFGNKTFPFEQFDLRLNRPDLILEQLPFPNKSLIPPYYKAYQKRLEKMDFKESMFEENFNVPIIQINNKETLPLFTSDKSINLKIKAHDNLLFLDRLNVWVNDVPVYGIKGKSLLQLQTKEIETGKNIDEVNVLLSEGKNKIQVSIHNQNGIESLRKTTYINHKKSSKKPVLHLISIGISSYEQEEYNLNYATKDGDDFLNTFRNHEKKYSKILEYKFFDKEATKENILLTKQKLKETQIDDEVILFIAGHGLLDKNLDYFFATTETDFENPSIKGIPFNLLENLLDSIPARKKLMLIDACHSGEIDKEGFKPTKSINKEIRGKVTFRGFKKVKGSSSLGLQNSFELMKSLFADLRRGTGTIIISSASGVEFSLESNEWKNGVFTYSLINGLKNKEADLDKDGEIHVSELRKYVSDKVSFLTNGFQHPTIRNENLDNDFILW